VGRGGGAEFHIDLVGDRDRIEHSRAALPGLDETVLNPVMDDPKADAITLADLADAQRSLRSGQCGDAMAVAQESTKKPWGSSGCGSG
jgi:hypothetical protein